MRQSTAALALLVVTLTVPRLSAQVAVSRPDSAQAAALFARGQRSAKPASVALEHREELGLTPQQIASLEPLVRAQADSDAVRFSRNVSALMGRQPSAAGLAMISWTGPVDEKAIRDEVCAQAQRSVEITLDMIRDRHAVGAILTPAQAAMMNEMLVKDMIKIMQRP